MPTEVVDNLNALRRLRPEWELLPMPSPMQSPAWLIAWWEAYGETEASCELHVVVVRDAADRLIGIAPFYKQCRSLAGTTLRLLGDGRASTDHQTLLCSSAEEEPAVVHAIAELLISTVGQTWRRLRFEALDVDDRAMNQLERLLEEAGLDTERIADIGSFPALLPMAEDISTAWDAYLATLSKNRRKKLRRWEREFFDSGRAQVRLVQSEQERRDLWPLLVRLHNERRAGMGKQGVFECDRFNLFHQLVSEQLLKEGRLYFAVLEIDGEPAAIEYALQDEQAIYAYQGGIADYAIDLEAGHLSMIALVKHALRTGRTRLDLLRGDEPYKLSWGATLRPASTLHVRPATFGGAFERWAGTTYRRVRDARLVVSAAESVANLD